MPGTGMRKTGRKLIHSVRGMLCLILALILTAGTACAEVYIDQEKPEDWEERYLLRIYALRSLDCDAYVLECDGETMILDGGKNAALLAAEILAVTDEELAGTLDARRSAEAEAVLEKDAGITSRLK